MRKLSVSALWAGSAIAPPAINLVARSLPAPAHTPDEAVTLRLLRSAEGRSACLWVDPFGFFYLRSCKPLDLREALAFREAVRVSFGKEVL